MIAGHFVKKTDETSILSSLRSNGCNVCFDKNFNDNGVVIKHVAFIYFQSVLGHMITMISVLHSTGETCGVTMLATAAYELFGRIERINCITVN